MIYKKLSVHLSARNYLRRAARCAEICGAGVRDIRAGVGGMYVYEYVRSIVNASERVYVR